MPVPATGAHRDGDRRLTPRGEERKRQLLAFAVNRFAENGYHPTSVAELVAGVGVGKGVFYWYFDTKEQLFLELLRDAQRDLRHTRQAAIGQEPAPLRRIELAIRASMRWWADHRDLVNLFQFAATDERFAPALRQGQQRAVAETASHLTEAMADGSVPAGDADLLARAVLGATVHLASERIHGRGDDADEVADAAVAFCLGGLRHR